VIVLSALYDPAAQAAGLAAVAVLPKLFTSAQLLAVLAQVHGSVR
jgi:hypothetical protein